MEQNDLVRITGLSTRTISDLENNKMERIPISKVAEVLEIEDACEIIDF